jgi:hypothetical protein
MSCAQLTQKQQVLKHMRQHGSITTLVASDKYRICRLSERIRELERDGYLINHTWVKRRGVMYTAYSLVEGRKRAA